MKSATLSVRVDDDDAAFLAGLEIDGAKTPSEKLRALLQAERRRQEGGGDWVEAGDMFRDLLQPAKRRIRRMEQADGERSEFVAKVFERLPDLTGVAFAGPPEGEDSPKAAVRRFERQLLGEVFLFIQEILELGLTSRDRCYDPGAIAKRLPPILEILELINISKQKASGGLHG